MNKLEEVAVKLSEWQKNRIYKAQPNKTIIINLKKDCLEGSDKILVNRITSLMIQDRKGERGLWVKILPLNHIKKREDGFYIM